METMQISNNWWMDKQNVVCPHTGVLFCHKEEWRSDTCYHMDELWENYAKWNKPDTKGHVLPDSIHVKHSYIVHIPYIFYSIYMNRQIHRDKKQIRGCKEPWRRGNGAWLLMGMRFILGVMKMFWNYIEVITCDYTKNNWIISFKK